jgi:hypothetical protein
MCGVRLSDFRTEEQNLRRVIDPDEQHDDGRGGAIGLFETLRADVPSDDKATQPYVPPFHMLIRQPVEEHGEKKRKHTKRYSEVYERK